AHAGCLPSQVVRVTEEQLQGAVKSISGGDPLAGAQEPEKVVPEQAVLGVTSGLVLIAGELHPALVVEPTAPVVRPGTAGPGDEFLPLLIEQGFMPVTELSTVPPVLHGWSVLLAMGQLHAVLQPGADDGRPVAWWQAHQPLQV
ncbi:hypothetical protein NGM37_48255, partial [Streptomyces sp. TRM76130]|nr:hypothetical protein [Streptomyces sp. TRM76130]